MNKKRIGITVAIFILVALVGLFGALIGFITDYLWFRELGYTSVFFKQLFTQLKLGIPSFLILTGLSYLYLMGLKRGYYKRVDIVDSPGIKEKNLNLIALGISAVFGLLITLSTVTRLWFEILKFGNSTDFNIADPIFNLDISFYIFKLELITHVNQIIIGVIVAFIILTVLFYMLLLSTRRPKIFEQPEGTEYEYTESGEQRYTGNFTQGFGSFGQNINDALGGMFKGFTPPPRRGGSTQLDKDNLKQLVTIASKQIKVLSVIFFLMVGVNFWLKQYQLLYSGTGVLYGAGFTDINVTLWVYRALVVLSVVAAVTFVMGMQKKSIKMMLATPLIMIILSVAGTGMALFVQNIFVSPDEINKESPYLQNNISYTQYAYNLQNISITEFEASNTLTKEDILNNMGTISNIRINDFEPAEKFYNQAQSIRTYYQFNDVDVDRYMINGEYTQTFLSAREIDESNPVMVNQPWLSKHLKYTHGYGITLSRVDKVTESGQPDMLIKSIPPISEVDEITIDRPEIYFGELTNNYVITNTDELEFDYPSGDKNVYSTYEGNAGINLNIFNRILFAIREQSLKILVSNNIDSDSKILINRNIKTRVQTIAPFLSYDQDPYIVTVDGKLYWMLDAYTYSSYYPYSEPFDPENKVNYIRNSIKIVVDAYNGDTSFYMVDSDDPIAQTLKKIYPKLVKDFDEMPENLKKHIRYPNRLFSIQAGIYTKYHMNDVKVFYQSEDRWEISQNIYGIEPQLMTPTYYIMKLPGEEKEEFINSIPYTPYGKKNMTGLLVARNDGENYGEIILFRLPKSKIIYGPMQVEGFIDQETDISKEFSLWNSAGSSYTRGEMFVIPIEDSLVYVEPIYLEATNSSLPEVKRVIIYYNDRIAYEPTLAQALDTMFGEGSGSPLNGEAADEPGGTSAEKPEEGILNTDALIRKAVDAYNNAVSAQEKGDWSAYGDYLRELEGFLNKLNAGAPKEIDIPDVDLDDVDDVDDAADNTVE